MLQFDAVEKYASLVFETVIVKKFRVFPPLLLIHIPYNYLPQRFLNNVLSLIFSFKFNLGRTVTATRQATYIILSLPLRLQHIVRCKGYIVRLFDQEISHTDQKLIASGLCRTKPELDIDRMGLTLVCKINAQSDFGIIIVLDEVLQQVVFFRRYL